MSKHVTCGKKQRRVKRGVTAIANESEGMWFGMTGSPWPHAVTVTRFMTELNKTFFEVSK